MRTAIYIIAFIALSLGVAFTIRFTDVDKIALGKTEIKKGNKNKKDDWDAQASKGVEILKKHEVPAILREISALVYLDNNHFACVQDELGTIFIYNTLAGKIEKEIPFTGAGDFEGLAIAGQTAYVLRSDGQIFEVKEYASGKPVVRTYETHLTAEQNTEGLCYDAKNNRLLVAIKGNEQQTDAYKGIYSFSLSSYKMDATPVYKIDLTNPAFAGFKVKKKGSQIQPSAIAIHPKTGDMYIMEAANPKLIVLDQQGEFKSLKLLSNKDFFKPEGISFSPEGNIYISNEGKKDPGNILEVAIL
jgi:uncharacterized protein YjiK